MVIQKEQVALKDGKTSTANTAICDAWKHF